MNGDSGCARSDFGYPFTAMSMITSLFSALTGGGSQLVKPEEAARKVKAGTAVLIDVREADEWAEGVAGPAALLALSDLRRSRADWGPFLAANRDKELILYCHSGGRSGMAARLLCSEGFRAANLGGFSDWVGAGLPTRKP